VVVSWNIDVQTLELKLMEKDPEKEE
jgi:hypothetical protein